MADATRQATAPMMRKEVNMHGQRWTHQFAGGDEKTAEAWFSASVACISLHIS